MDLRQRIRFDSFDVGKRTRFLDSGPKTEREPTRNPWEGMGRRVGETAPDAIDRFLRETRAALVDLARERERALELDVDWR